jgi:hypothetical protein
MAYLQVQSVSKERTNPLAGVSDSPQEHLMITVIKIGKKSSLSKEC